MMIKRFMSLMNLIIECKSGETSERIVAGGHGQGNNLAQLNSAYGMVVNASCFGSKEQYKVVLLLVELGRKDK